MYNYFDIKKIPKKTLFYHGTHYNLNKITTKILIKKKLFFELKRGIYNTYIYITPEHEVSECYSFRRIGINEDYKLPIIFNLINVDDLLFLNFLDDAHELSKKEAKEILQLYDGLYRESLCSTGNFNIIHDDYALFYNDKIKTIGYSIYLNNKWSKNLSKKELINIIYEISL